MAKIYLAIPYTGMEEENYRIANKVAGELLSQGNIVYSPISHSHSIAKEYKLPTSWEFWQEVDKSFIEWCDYLYIVVIDNYEKGLELIRKSKGCMAELKLAEKLNKKVIFLKYWTGFDLSTKEKVKEYQKWLDKEWKIGKLKFTGLVHNDNLNKYYTYGKVDILSKFNRRVEEGR